MQYLRAHFDGLLADLAAALNEVLGTQKSVAFWRYLIGPWLHRFIGYVLVHLDSSPAAEPPLRRVPAGYDEFGACSHMVSYARVVDADIARAPVLGSAGPLEHPRASMRPLIWRRRLKSIVKSLHWLAQGVLLRQGKVIVREGYFPRSAELKIWWLSRGRIRFDRRDYGWSPDSLIVDQFWREALAAKLAGTKTEPEETIRRLIPLHLPRCYLEGFDSLRQSAERMFRRPAAAYFTCAAHLQDEVFKYHVGDAKAAGAKLLAAQHGGNHGISKLITIEDFEREIADLYCTWGWQEDERTIPLPAPKLMGLSECSAAVTTGEILFVGSTVVAAECRRDVMDGFLPADVYLSWQRRFLEGLPPQVRRHVRFRTLRDMLGGSWTPLKKSFPDVVFENAYECGVPFPKRLASCALYVCDQLGTTYAEALVLDRPMILFWDREASPLRRSAEPYFDAFHACGILHYSPETAAREVAKAYGDVAAWWADPARQKAVRDFRDHYLLTDKNASVLWTNFLLEQAAADADASEH